MSQMKIVSGVIALFAHATLLHAAEAFPRFTLETENHVVEITTRCRVGSVACDRVSYRGVDKKTGATIVLRGKSLHTTCADGVTPCRFLGYRFRKGKHYYYVWEDADGEKGTLEVIAADSKVLLQEPGTWH